MVSAISAGIPTTTRYLLSDANLSGFDPVPIMIASSKFGDLETLQYAEPYFERSVKTIGQLMESRERFALIATEYGHLDVVRHMFKNWELNEPASGGEGLLRPTRPRPPGPLEPPNYTSQFPEKAMK